MCTALRMWIETIYDFVGINNFLLSFKASLRRSAVSEAVSRDADYQRAENIVELYAWRQIQWSRSQ